MISVALLLSSTLEWSQNLFLPISVVSTKYDVPSFYRHVDNQVPLPSCFILLHAKSSSFRFTTSYGCRARPLPTCNRSQDGDHLSQASSVSLHSSAAFLMVIRSSSSYSNQYSDTIQNHTLTTIHITLIIKSAVYTTSKFVSSSKRMALPH